MWYGVKGSSASWSFERKRRPRDDDSRAFMSQPRITVTIGRDGKRVCIFVLFLRFFFGSEFSPVWERHEAFFRFSLDFHFSMSSSNVFIYLFFTRINLCLNNLGVFCWNPSSWLSLLLWNKNKRKILFSFYLSNTLQKIRAWMYAAISVSGVALYKEPCLLVGAWKTAPCQNSVPFKKKDCEQSVHQCVCVIGVCPVSLVAVTSTREG
jgi:hypothetical protein